MSSSDQCKIDTTSQTLLVPAPSLNLIPATPTFNSEESHTDSSDDFDSEDEYTLSGTGDVSLTYSYFVPPPSSQDVTPESSPLRPSCSKATATTTGGSGTDSSSDSDHPTMSSSQSSSSTSDGSAGVHTRLSGPRARPRFPQQRKDRPSLSQDALIKALNTPPKPLTPPKVTRAATSPTPSPKAVKTGPMLPPPVPTAARRAASCNMADTEDGDSASESDEEIVIPESLNPLFGKAEFREFGQLYLTLMRQREKREESMERTQQMQDLLNSPRRPSRTRSPSRARGEHPQVPEPVKRREVPITPPRGRTGGSAVRPDTHAHKLEDQSSNDSSTHSPTTPSTVMLTGRQSPSPFDSPRRAPSITRAKLGSVETLSFSRPASPQGTGEFVRPASPYRQASISSRRERATSTIINEFDTLGRGGSRRGVSGMAPPTHFTSLLGSLLDARDQTDSVVRSMGCGGEDGTGSLSSRRSVREGAKVRGVLPSWK